MTPIFKTIYSLFKSDLKMKENTFLQSTTEKSLLFIVKSQRHNALKAIHKQDQSAVIITFVDNESITIIIETTQ